MASLLAQACLKKNVCGPRCVCDKKKEQNLANAVAFPFCFFWKSNSIFFCSCNRSPWAICHASPESKPTIYGGTNPLARTWLVSEPFRGPTWLCGYPKRPSYIWTNARSRAVKHIKKFLQTLEMIYFTDTKGWVPKN